MHTVPLPTDGRRGGTPAQLQAAAIPAPDARGHGAPAAGRSRPRRSSHPLLEAATLPAPDTQGHCDAAARHPRQRRSRHPSPLVSGMAAAEWRTVIFLLSLDKRVSRVNP
jgi:hypothetical protein